MIAVSLVSKGLSLKVECKMNRHRPEDPFPVLYIGNDITIQPDISQLRDIRNAIDSFLKMEAA